MTKMTLDEFLAHLRNTPRTWQLKTLLGVKKSAIRNADGHCPIVAVRKHLHGIESNNDHFFFCGLALGLTSGDINAISAASDTAALREPRNSLLAATGIERGPNLGELICSATTSLTPTTSDGTNTASTNSNEYTFGNS